MSSQTSHYYAALKRLTRVANSASTLKRICNSIARSTAQAVQANGCVIFSLDSQGEYLLPVGVYGLSDLYLKKGPINAHRSLPEILEGKVVYIADAAKDMRVQYPQVAAAQGISCILGVPILAKGQTVGEIRIYTREPRIFSEADRSFLGSVANICSIVLEKAASAVAGKRI